MEAALGNLCYDLSVTNMISPTEEELLAAGYTPKDDFIEQMHEPWNAPEGVVPGEFDKSDDDRQMVCFRGHFPTL